MGEYIDSIKKVKCNRKTKIHHSIGANEAYNYYKKLNGKLTSEQFRKTIKLINLYLQESIAEGESIDFPQKMGRIELRKFNSSVDFKDGKLITNLPVDWNETLKLWENDKQAEKEKLLVRIETPHIYRLYYKRQKANYKNKTMMQFTTNRDLKLKLKNNIKEKKVDAFLVN